MIVTRFAPSPTGYLHIGGLRTAIFSYFWAKKNNGKFLLRIEDTDRSRHNEDAVGGILKAFEWVGIKSDEEIVYQSERTEIYKKYIDQLLETGRAYKCYMSKEELDQLREEQTARKERPKYDGRYRNFTGVPPIGIEPVIRIKSPESGNIIVKDLVKGDVVFSVEDNLDDFIIARADGMPTYNFVVAVDDAVMGVTDVIRGDDHLSNTPKQIVVYEALNFKLPNFYHVPMIHNSEGKKLSKRDGATDVLQYREYGYLPDALLNFLLRLGWSYGDKELFSREEMINLFDPSGINKSASIFSIEKLNWINGEKIKNLSRDEIANLLNINSSQIIDLVKDRCSTLKDLEREFLKIENRPENYDEASLKKHYRDDNKKLLNIFYKKIKDIDHDFISLADSFAKVLEDEKVGMAKLAQPLRIAIVGIAQSPSVVDLISILGRDEVISRIEIFFEKVK